MKKVILAAFLLVSSNAIFAQLNQGQWLVGGNIGFTSSKFSDEDGDKVSTFEINPNAGYFIIDKLAAGLRLGFESIKVKSADDATVNWSLAPFVRYYVLDKAQMVNVFADGSYGFGKYGAADKVSYNFFQIMAGPAVFLTPNTALEFTVRYRSEGGDLYPDDRASHFGFNVGFQIHLGNGNGMK